jgi:extradiol dioxygenase family protein
MTELSLFNVSGNSFGYLYLGYSVSKKTELIRFRFYKPEIKKKIRKKSSQTGKNRVNQKKIEPSQFEPTLFF